MADVIDSDSWRIWPSSDKRLVLGKQVYRDMEQVTDEGLGSVLSNFEWVYKQLEDLTVPRLVFCVFLRQI